MVFTINLIVTIILLLCTTITTRIVFAQLYADTNVAWCLRECYNNSEFSDANFKLPMSMNILIDLIRKIERGPTPMDSRMLSTSILHRFRQDGIKRATIKSDIALPYSPNGFENNKFKIVYRYLVPGSAISFPNDTLTPLERCTIHKMLSESIDAYERGDEDRVCRGLAKYQRRIPRDLNQHKQNDVETIDEKLLLAKGTKKRGNLQQPNPDGQVDVINTNTNTNTKQSSCPIENGVVYTSWGAVSAGDVLSGIAAGTEPQTIDIRKMDVNTRQQHLLDNVWGATLAANIAEDAFLSVGSSIDIKVGGSGDWNSTIIPQGYYLSSNDIQYFTDAEIRGNLDGLILGTEMKTLKDKVRSLKLSQLLDMYYSQQGLFGGEVKACKRKELLAKYATTEDMQLQGTVFGIVLNHKVTIPVSMDSKAISVIVKDTVDKLSRYIPQSLNDLNCLNDNDYGTISTDLIIFLDCSWPFDIIYLALANLVNNIDINPYNSNFTIVNANDGSLIINSTYSLIDFYLKFNSTNYGKQSPGFDVAIAYKQAEILARNRMDAERNGVQPPGGKSMVALLVANMNSIDANKKETVIKQLNENIQPQIPDLKFLALTSGSKETFDNLVKDTSGDVFQLSSTGKDNNAIITAIAPLIKRIKNVPRRVVSTKCGSDWKESGSEKQCVQYIEMKGTNYYRVHPNYFFGAATRSLKIRGQGNGLLKVCYSREIEFPKSSDSTNTTSNNSSSGSTNCKAINSDEFVIDLSNACNGASYIKDCAPLYFSVEAPQVLANGQLETCTESGCRYTHNLKFLVTPDNFGCFSSAHISFVNMFLLTIIFIISLFK